MLFSFNKVVGISLVALLMAGCTSDNRYKREVAGDDSYLNSPELRAIQVPSGLTFPLHSSSYDVNRAKVKGHTGKQLDIRAPVQPFAGLDGSSAHYANGVATLLAPNNQQNQDIWSKVKQSLQQKNIGFVVSSDAKQQLETDWVNWSRKDEDTSYQARYLISVKPYGSEIVLTSKLLELRHQLNPILDLIEVQRYSLLMLNALSLDLLKQELEIENQQIAQSVNTSAIYLQTGRDDTGLPNIIARASYAVTWARLPAALERMGMTVIDKEQSKGIITVKYNGLNEKGWEAIPDIKETEYKIQVGDLNNRASLQFSEVDGEYLQDSQNKALLPVLEAALAVK